MTTLTTQFLKATKNYVTLGGDKTQEDVVSDIINAYCIDNDYQIGKNRAYDLFKGRSIYKATIVEYYWDDTNYEYLVSDIEKLILANVYWREKYVNDLYAIVKNSEDIPEEFLRSIFLHIEARKYAEAVAEIFKVVIGYDMSVKRIKEYCRK
ncbi:MAG: hypothetical protein E7195_01625 [Peptococcaceae bacterium]|nr:hypothetical protein [Peptococcaceae bacterium]